MTASQGELVPYYTSAVAVLVRVASRSSNPPSHPKATRQAPARPSFALDEAIRRNPYTNPRPGIPPASKMSKSAQETRGVIENIATHTATHTRDSVTCKILLLLACHRCSQCWNILGKARFAHNWLRIAQPPAMPGLAGRCTQHLQPRLGWAGGFLR